MKKIIIFLMMVFVLAACGQADSNNGQGEEKQEVYPLKVDLQVPEKANVHEKVALTAEVTYGGKAVKDADEVMFEIWKDGTKDESKMIEAKHSKDGQYTIEYTFDQDGVFFVQSHVTAKDQHNMPKKQIVVGQSEGAESSENVKDEHEHGHHSHSSVSVQLDKSKTIKVNEEAVLKVKIQKENTPLSKANVRFEIWKDGSEKHDWVDAAEESSGVYQAKHQFSEPGTFQIQVHITNDEGLHEHLKDTLTVQE